MTDLQSGELIDLMPPYFKYDTEVMAYSAAIKIGTDYMLEYAKRTMLSADIDELPEYLINYLAVETDASYYTEDMPIETKRELVKNALYWKAEAGSITAVSELVTAVLGDSVVREWYEFDGEPYTFKIAVPVSPTPENYQYLVNLIKTVKSVHSKLIGITTIRNSYEDIYMGVVTSARLKNVPIR
jgi:phage tail P2-like protein